MNISRRELMGGLAAAGLWHALAPARAMAGAKAPFPELSAAGSPGTLGLAHGRRFARAVGHNVRFYLRWLGQATGSSRPQLLAAARRFVPVLQQHQPALLEEMRGIAKGAHRSLEEVLAVNARTDLLVVGQRAKRKAALTLPPPRAVPGCTALALSRGSGQLALGQNWDWRKELSKGIVLLRLRPAGRPPLVTFTEAGMVGKVGFNARRLGVCLNFLSHKDDDPHGPIGVPVHVLLRAVMECDSLEQAYKMVAWSPRCASANFLMAQHGSKPAALDLELTPSAVGRLLPREGRLVHTNHFKNPALAPGCTSGRGRSTMNRDRQARRLARELASKVADSALRMTRVLASRDGAPYAVSKTSAPDSPSQTLAGIVMDLGRNQLRLCAGPPHAGRWVRCAGV